VIVFDLACQDHGHRFEGWFGSSRDFAAQQERGLVTCPQCGSGDVIKAPMAANLGRKGNQIAAASQASGPGIPVTGKTLPPQAAALMQAMAQMQAAALKESRWVGEGFAETSRAIHYGERAAETIHGQATAEEAIELIEEGIEVMPLPFPVAPPAETN
jgi:hypothetical protein